MQSITHFAFGLSLLGAVLTSHAAGSHDAILNGLTLGRTDLTAYVAKMRPSCPGIDLQLNAVALVPTACYKLPGNVVILMADPADPKHTVVSAAIMYKKDPDAVTFRKFYDALRKKYGQPEDDMVNEVTKRVIWRLKNMYIMIGESVDEPQGQLCYADKTFWETRVEGPEREKASKEKAALDSML